MIVIGGSDQGRQVLDAILARGFHTAVGVLDRALPRDALIAGVPVLGNDDDLAMCAAEVGADHFVVAIGDNGTRGTVLERAIAAVPGLEPATIVHPSAVIGHNATVGPGAILLAGCVVGNGSHVGRGALLGIHSSIDHDGVLGDHTSLGPGATTGGAVSIGTTTAVGLGANIIHGVTIGADTVMGAGALVLSDLPECVVAYGVPARVARNRQPGEPYL
ncbi:MAG TPA: NeuD/PglB/VioB family sugar acetyltransferase [Acidimicrobiia bacterium]|nr:NeuD/PglB/VioB family sugar acetyltransferase [Acidimicrobiia bacterium]